MAFIPGSMDRAKRNTLLQTIRGYVNQGIAFRLQDSPKPRREGNYQDKYVFFKLPSSSPHRRSPQLLNVVNAFKKLGLFPQPYVAIKNKKADLK
jgi:hypothetical protein